MRLYNLQIQKRGYNRISVPKMLRKSAGNSFTHLNKSSLTFSFVKEKQYTYNNKIYDFCNISSDSFGTV